MRIPCPEHTFFMVSVQLQHLPLSVRRRKRDIQKLRRVPRILSSQQQHQRGLPSCSELSNFYVFPLIASLSFPLETGDCGRPHEPLGMGLKGSELRTTVGDSSQVCRLLIAAPSHLSSHALTAPSLHTDQSSSLFRPFAKEKQALGVYSTCE